MSIKIRPYFVNRTSYFTFVEHDFSFQNRVSGSKLG